MEDERRNETAFRLMAGILAGFQLYPNREDMQVSDNGLHSVWTICVLLPLYFKMDEQLLKQVFLTSLQQYNRIFSETSFHLFQVAKSHDWQGHIQLEVSLYC